MLDLAKIESGALSVSMENVDLDDVFQECLRFIGPMAERYGITVDCEINSTRQHFVRAD